MAINLCKAFFRIKSNILYINCSVNNVRSFQSLRLTPELFKYSKLTIFKEDIFKTKRSFTFLPCRRQLNKLLAGLAIAQLALFFGISWALLPIVPPRKKDQPLLNYVMKTKLPIALIVTPIVCGILGPILMYLFITRAIRYIILHKGGNKITVVTQHIVGKPSQITLPTSDVSVNKTRNELQKYMAVKLGKIPFFYLIHKEGTFVNPELFDHSIAYKKRGT